LPNVFRDLPQFRRCVVIAVWMLLEAIRNFFQLSSNALVKAGRQG
jgi:hypothetical protein